MDRAFGHEFSVGERVHVFEHGSGSYSGYEGYSDENDTDLYRIKMKRNTIVVSSYDCFGIEASGKPFRLWTMGNAQIKVTDSPIQLTLSGASVTMRYSLQELVEFRSGDDLPEDWEGYGVDFKMLINKWLRRLNGEIIPLSANYLNSTDYLLAQLHF